MRKACVLLFCLAFGWMSCGGPDAPSGYRIAVVPKSTTHEFWRSVHAGAVKAERELTQQGTPTEVIWKGPLREDDREQQIQVVFSQGVQGIVLAPLDDQALIRPVEEALRGGIPTVIIDSDLASEAIVSFVATDNRKGGELAAERLGHMLEGRGKVILLRYLEGSASTRNREAGFLERLAADFPEIEILSADQYGGPTRDTAKRAAENLLNRFGRQQIDGIFCANQVTAVGMLLALQDIELAGRVKFVGFDATEILVEAMRAGEMDGLVIQNPLRMGYLGVRSMVEHLEGKAVDRRIDTGVTMVTPDRLDEPEIRELLFPPLERYLEENPTGE